MKIIQMIPSLLNAGGAERFLINLSIAQKNLGHDVLIIVLYNNKSNFFQQDIDKNNLKVVYLNKKKGFDIGNSILLRKKVMEFAPDVVHTHINCHLSMKLSGLWKKNKNIKYFHTIHSVPEVECPKPFLFSIMKPLYRKNIVEPITISDSLSQKTKEYYKLSKSPRIIYNGIFVEDFTNSNVISKRKTSFISIGRFDLSKNQMNIAKATVTLRAKGFNIDTVFLGKGKEMDNVKKYVENNNGLNYIHFLGEVNNVSDYLSEAKCFVIPSWFEGNPISILESMAAGLAIIATKIGGPKDMIIDGENGFLIDPYNIDELIAKMENLLTNDILLNQISSNNIFKVKKYDMYGVAMQYIDCYSSKKISYNR